MIECLALMFVDCDDKSRIIGNCRRLKTNGRFVSQGAKSTLGIKTIYPRLHSEMISAVMKFR